jgi:dienelactone hydrolase
MRTEEIAYQADGLTMRSRLYLPEGGAGRRPGVLVFPDVLGLGEHALSRAERLADLGYVALACDLHGERRVYPGFKEVMPILAALRRAPAKMRARSRGGFDALVARPEVDAAKMGAIGFCFGGTMALELARDGADMAAVVGFHSGLATASPEDARRIKGKVLVCIGADDPAVPPDQRAAFEAEMREARVDWRMHLYGGVVHSFTDPAADARGIPERARYDAGADRRSWAEMLALFDEVFGPR